MEKYLWIYTDLNGHQNNFFFCLPQDKIETRKYNKNTNFSTGCCLAFPAFLELAKHHVCLDIGSATETHLLIFARAEVLFLLCQKAFGVGGWQERKAERRAGGFESGITRQAASPLLPLVLFHLNCRNIFLECFSFT